MTDQTAPRYQPYGNAGMLSVEQCEYSVVDNDKGAEICRCWDVDTARHIAFRMNLDNPAADTLADQQELIDELEKALARLVEVYAGMEDENGDPCPDVIKGRATLAKAKERVTKT